MKNLEYEFFYLYHFKDLINQNKIDGEYFCDYDVENNLYIDKDEFMEYFTCDDYYDKENSIMVKSICEENNLFDISSYQVNEFQLLLSESQKEKILQDIEKYTKLELFL